MKMLNLESELEIAENYHKHTEKAFESLKSEVDSYLKTQPYLALLKVLGAVAIAALSGGKRLTSYGMGIVSRTSFI